MTQIKLCRPLGHSLQSKTKAAKVVEVRLEIVIFLRAGLNGTESLLLQPFQIFLFVTNPPVN